MSPTGRVHPRPREAGCSPCVILLPPALSLSLSFLAGRCPLCHLGTLSCLCVSTQEPSPGPFVSQKSLKEAVASQLHVGDLPPMLAFGLGSYLPGSRSQAFSALMAPTPPMARSLNPAAVIRPHHGPAGLLSLRKTHSNSLKA